MVRVCVYMYICVYVYIHIHVCSFVGFATFIFMCVYLYIYILFCLFTGLRYTFTGLHEDTISNHSYLYGTRRSPRQEPIVLRNAPNMRTSFGRRMLPAKALAFRSHGLGFRV